MLLAAVRAAVPTTEWLSFRLLSVVSPMPRLVRTGDPRVAFRQAVATGFTWGEGLLSLATLLCYLVWFARAYQQIRATRGATRFSTGMAVGGWFIPFVNLVMPYLALRDAVRRGANDERGGLVVLWWTSYLLATLLTTTSKVLQGLPALEEKISQVAGIRVLNLYWTTSFWSEFVLHTVAWGSLAVIVRGLTKALARR